MCAKKTESAFPFGVLKVLYSSLFDHLYIGVEFFFQFGVQHLRPVLYKYAIHLGGSMVSFTLIPFKALSTLPMISLSITANSWAPRLVDSSVKENKELPTNPANSITTVKGLWSQIR